MVKLLSYPLRVGDPGWPGNPTFHFDQFTSIESGEVANTYTLHLFNHFGSHMDGPNHFNESGIQLYQVPTEQFVYRNVVLLDIPKNPQELVNLEDIKPYLEQIRTADLILFRSCFSKYRATQPELYSHRGPGISSDVAKYFMDECPNLKAIGMDWISLASYQHPEEGTLAHQYLLGKFHNRYILIIEDLNFDDVAPNDLGMVVAAPLRIEGVDSAPCCVYAFSEHD